MRKYEPVAYDKFIDRSGSLFRAVIREDGKRRIYMCRTFDKAQKVLACFRPDIFEGLTPPPSVFCKGTICETLVM